MGNPLRAATDGLHLSTLDESLIVADGKRLAAKLCLGLRTLRSLDAAGKLPAPVRIGGKVVWVLGGEWGIHAWLAAGAPCRAEWEARKAASQK